MSKLVWITGISKCGGNEYLEEKLLPICEQRDKRVEILYPGKMLFDKHAPGDPIDNKDNVLQVPDDKLWPKMQWVFDEIVKKIEIFRELDTTVIIKTHRLFKWENVYRLAHVYESIININPDLMFTFIDGVVPTQERLKKSDQFCYQDYSKKDICEWQDLEVKLTKEWAEAIKKPHFVIPSGESSELLYNLIFNPKPELTYVAIDITRSNPEIEKQVENFVKKLRKYYPCLINPYIVPMDYKNRTKEENSHIIAMCLDWFVPQAKNVVGYYPAALPTSEGKTHEIGKAYILAKNVWIVHLPETNKASPFIEGFKTVPIFRSEKDFFEFLENGRKK